MSPHARTRRGGWENRGGWWGILRWSAAASVAALLVTVLAWAPAGAAAAWSAVLGGGVVVVLSALTGATTALAWDHARALALPLGMGAFVLKVVLFMVLLTVVPRPGWLQALPAGVAALVALVVWQVVEVLVFARTRRAIYAD